MGWLFVVKIVAEVYVPFVVVVPISSKSFREGIGASFTDKQLPVENL